MYKINETPVRTAKNFKINNIEIEEDVIPSKIKEFTNIDIINNGATITNNPCKERLIYGTGEELEKNIFENANHTIKINATEKKNSINIVYNFDDDNLELVNNIEIVAENDVNIIIKYQSSTEKECFHNGLIRLYAKENAKINMIIINLLNDSSNNFEAIENEIQKNANVKYTIMDIGGNYSVSNYYSNIIGEKAKNDLQTIYLGRKNQIKDINYIGELKGIKSEINIDVQGALKDNAKKNFKGTINFKKGCKKAKGSENEYCMLLSDKAKSIALPMLLCTEEDVEGSHSTASGKAEADILFYIMSRGISYKEAIKLIVRANFNKILERINDEKLEEEIIQEIDRRLG